MASTTIKYIGRKTDFSGKTLWEILGNLKNHGVGRYVYRNMFQRYPEPSYMKIVRVEALAPPKEGDRKVKVWVEKTFRGRTLPKLVEIESASYKTDYRLIPRDQEEEFCRPITDKNERILPSMMELPPLLREYIKHETGQTDPKLPVKIRLNREKIVRVAKEGEAPTIEMIMSLGKPASPTLYSGLDL